MKRPITVKFEDQILMFTVDIQRKDDKIVYHLENDSTLDKFGQDLPVNFNIVKQHNSDAILLKDLPMTERGRSLADAIWKVLQSHPPQFKGGDKMTVEA
ncbi:MAG TPA: hypothetical protein VGC22_14130 [Chitinophaga sp.]